MAKQYAEARNRIQTGDLIAFRKRGGLLATLTRWVTRSPYTHTALALWVGCGQHRRLLVAEAKASGAFLTPLSQYAEESFDIFRAPGEVASTIEQALWETLGVPIGYDFADLVRIAANRLIGWPLPEADNVLKICSALSATIWLQAGWHPKRLPSIPAPCDVVAALDAPPALEVRPTKRPRGNCLTYAWRNWRYRRGDHLVVRKSHWGWFPHFLVMSKPREEEIVIKDFQPVSPKKRTFPPIIFRGKEVTSAYRKTHPSESQPSTKETS